MQRVPVYRLTFASIPFGRVRPEDDELSVHPVVSEPDRHDPPTKPEAVFCDADHAGPIRTLERLRQPVRNRRPFLPSHRGDRCSTLRLKGLRHPPNPSAGPASPQRLAVYPRAERDNCAGDSRAVEKVAGGFLVFFAGFRVRY